jgi:hypothetical protein
MGTPLPARPQVWVEPAVSDENRSSILTLKGEVRCVRMPSPNCPPSFSPQHAATPLVLSPHRWETPAVIATKPRPPPGCSSVLDRSRLDN